MAIKIKSMNGMAALKKLGLSEGTLSWLEQSPVEVSLSATRFTFTVPHEAGAKHYFVDVTLNELQKLSLGTLPEHDMLKLRAAVGQTIKEIVKEHFGGVVKVPENAGADYPKTEGTTLGDLLQEALAVKPKSALGKLPPLKNSPDAVKEKPTKSEAWPTFDVSKLTSAAPVELRKATMMYQPVMGTSAGSRYFLVAANEDIRVAARIKKGTLSVRIEGPSWKKYVSNIQTCGFDNVKDDYASIHLAVGEDVVLASKTLGAILLGLGVLFETPVPETKVIIV